MSRIPILRMDDEGELMFSVQHWPQNSRRVALGLPNYVRGEEVRWNANYPSFVPQRDFSMPASLMRFSGEEWFRFPSGGQGRWDGPTTLGSDNERVWYWKGLSFQELLTEANHRWLRCKPFLLALRDVHGFCVLLVAL